MPDADARPQKQSPSFGPALKGAIVKVFKETPQIELRLHLFFPEDHKPTDKRPAIVFFFGGGWMGGSPGQFHRHSQYLASRGMVAACAEYRVRRKHDTTPFECVADGKSAVRWLRAHAAELGIDSDRLAAGGGSAGGHVAASTAILKGFDEPGEDLSISCVPTALALFNPVVDSTETGWQGGYRQLGERAQELSPVHHLEKGAPPAIVFHGSADTTVPIENVERFRDKMKELGSECKLIVFEGKAHGFFNYGRDKSVAYKKTVREMDLFFVSLGYLSGEPMMDSVE